MTSIHYATYFDRHYLTRGLALYQSLVAHSPPFTLWVLCLDATVESVLRRLALPGIRLLALAELEAVDRALLKARPNRTTLEYYWTTTPAYLRHLLERDASIELLAYLDADLFFYADPSPLFDELGGGSMLAMPTDWTPEAYQLGPKSRFNLGMALFRRCGETTVCLERWREQCLDWCYDRFEPGRFGDQGYLDEWPELYSGFVAGRNLGARLGPWNLANYHLTAPDGRPRVDGAPVVFFHFGRFRIVLPWLFEPCFWIRRIPMTPVAKHQFVVPYARALRRALRQARAVSDEVPSRDLIARRLWQISPARMMLHRSAVVVTDSFAF